MRGSEEFALEIPQQSDWVTSRTSRERNIKIEQAQSAGRWWTDINNDTWYHLSLRPIIGKCVGSCHRILALTNIFLCQFSIALLNVDSIGCRRWLNWYDTGVPSNVVVLVRESLMSMYAGMYSRCTTGLSPIGGSSGWRAISTISPCAPFVRSRSISIFSVIITFMPMPNLNQPRTQPFPGTSQNRFRHTPETASDGDSMRLHSLCWMLAGW